MWGEEEIETQLSMQAIQRTYHLEKNLMVPSNGVEIKFTLSVGISKFDINYIVNLCVLLILCS